MRRALLLLGLLSCKVAYERYCVSSTDCPIEFPFCDPTNLCVPMPDAAGCMNDNNCPAANPHCVGGACVECRDQISEDCGLAKPICEDHVCRTCKADTECPTLCDTDLGTCVHPGDILYVTTGGSGTSCAPATPCAKISVAVAAISGTKHWIRVDTGNYADTVQIDTSMAVNIVGIGTVLVIPSGTAPIISVGASSNVLVRGLRLANGSDVNNDGIRCNGGDGTPLRLSQLQIDNNHGAGLNASRCNVTLERSRIFANRKGGLVLFQSGCTIRNNYIYWNGSDTSDTGGVHFVLAPVPPTVFEFNTLTRNFAMAGVGPGVHCDTALDISSVIVWGNGATQSVAQVGGNCSFDYSDIGGPAVPVSHNINMDPMFVDPAADRYDLAAGSPCIDKGQPGLGTTEDFQGEARPNGPLPDIGADEKY